MFDQADKEAAKAEKGAPPQEPAAADTTGAGALSGRVAHEDSWHPRPNSSCLPTRGTTDGSPTNMTPLERLKASKAGACRSHSYMATRTWPLLHSDWQHAHPPRIGFAEKTSPRGGAQTPEEAPVHAAAGATALEKLRMKREAGKGRASGGGDAAGAAAKSTAKGPAREAMPEGLSKLDQVHFSTRVVVQLPPWPFQHAPC